MLKEGEDMEERKGVMQNNEKYVAFLNCPRARGVGWDRALSSSLALKALILLIQTWGLQGLPPGQMVPLVTFRRT